MCLFASDVNRLGRKTSFFVTKKIILVVFNIIFWLFGSMVLVPDLWKEMLRYMKLSTWLLSCVSFFLYSCRTSTMNGRIGIYTKHLFIIIRGWPINSKKFLRYDWFSLWMVLLLLGDADGLIQNRFVFARRLIPLWIPYNYYGW